MSPEKLTAESKQPARCENRALNQSVLVARVVHIKSESFPLSMSCHPSFVFDLP